MQLESNCVLMMITFAVHVSLQDIHDFMGSVIHTHKTRGSCCTETAAAGEKALGYNLNRWEFPRLGGGDFDFARALLFH
jgi:hypothetical protein